MPNSMKIGSPLLRVKNIVKVLGFYGRHLGLHVNKKYQNDDDNFVYELGIKHLSSSAEKPSLLILQHDPNAKNASPD